MKQRIGPLTFIVKMLIISNTDNRLIYIKWKEGARRLAAGECVGDGESLKMEVASVVKTAIGETDQFGIS